MAMTASNDFNITAGTIEFWQAARAIGGWFTNASIRAKLASMSTRTIRHHTVRLVRAGVLETDVVYPRRFRPASGNDNPAAKTAIDNLDMLVRELKRAKGKKSAA